VALRAFLPCERGGDGGEEEGEEGEGDMHVCGVEGGRLWVGGSGGGFVEVVSSGRMLGGM